MTLSTNELFSSNAQTAPPRIFPTAETGMLNQKFATLAGGPTLAVGEALAFNTSTGLWVPWTNSGSNGTGTVRAFVYPVPITLSATAEVLGWMMIGGIIHADDMKDHADGTSSSNLRTAVKTPPSGPSLRENGIIVQGLPGIS